MSDLEDFPYCIWYPEVPTEETCRKLVDQHPQLRYLVGRACAVAGYTKLYQELNLLPEIHIAEEASDNEIMEIYNGIMESNMKYSTMDDYSRISFPDNPRLAYLNGDTAVRSSLEIKQKPHQPSKSGYLGLDELPFNITEDMNVGFEQMDTPEILDDVVRLLHSPLPPDLPTVNKDLLILMAAYYGDIDRYVRLRRPKMIPHELSCVIRGIYHQPMFANWWYTVEETRKPSIRMACHARFIMCNDLSHISDNMENPPTTLWYPDVASESIYRELARRVPRMKVDIARACIVANYAGLWTSLDPEPTEPLLAEAEASPNPWFLQELKKKISKLGDAPLPRALPGRFTRVEVCVSHPLPICIAQ
jgi:hypothetical protein